MAINPLRIFIALELPAPVKTALCTHVDRLRRGIPVQAVRWVDPESIHITLKFLGDVQPNLLDQVKAATAKACQGLSPIDLIATGAGCFPHMQRPKVVWIGIKGQKELLNKLRDQVEAEIAPLGFPTEARAFKPHLTIGRVKTTQSEELLGVGKVVVESKIGEVAAWQGTQVSIMQSSLKPSGAVYAALATYPL